MRCTKYMRDYLKVKHPRFYIVVKNEHNDARNIIRFFFYINDKIVNHT